MTLTDIANQVRKALRNNSPAILTGIGVSGTITTAYLAAKAAYDSHDVIRIEQNRLDAFDQSRPINRKEKAKLVWKMYIPAGLSGALTVGCIIGSTKIGTKRAAAAYSLASISEKAFIEYKEKVVEKLGEKQEKAVRDEIAQDRMTNQPVSQGVVIVGTGQVLCYEMHTGRYFNSDMETLRKAQNTINAQMIRENYANLNDFYHLVGLPSNSYSSVVGWTSDRMLELQFSTSMTDDSRPCITFDYNYVVPI